jgi:hypothetical protein
VTRTARAFQAQQEFLGLAERKNRKPHDIVGFCGLISQNGCGGLQRPESTVFDRADIVAEPQKKTFRTFRSGADTQNMQPFF